MEKLIVVNPANKDYLLDLIEVIKCYDDLSDGELKYLANVVVRKDSAANTIAEIMKKIPENYLIRIKQKAEAIDSQPEIIMFTEDLRYGND